MGLAVGLTAAHYVQTTTQLCIMSAVCGLLLGALVGHLAIEIEQCKDQDMNIVTALQNVFATQVLRQ
ncbi:UNVERIFIED_CONTAM: hypothetical protein LBW93_01985 [Wolbachia endosymbiont of Nasonia longicornis]